MLQWVVVKAKQTSELRSLKGMHLQLLFFPTLFSRRCRNDKICHVFESLVAEPNILEAMLITS